MMINIFVLEVLLLLLLLYVLYILECCGCLVYPGCIYKHSKKSSSLMLLPDCRCGLTFGRPGLVDSLQRHFHQSPLQPLSQTLKFVTSHWWHRWLE